MQHPESDDYPRQARILRDRHLMEILEVVEMRPRYHLCTNAANRGKGKGDGQGKCSK